MPPTGLRVQYKLGDNNPTNDQIKAIFNIINDSPMSVPLSELSIRYWYTLEGGEQPQAFFCDYALVGAGNVHGAFAAKAGVMADHYMEVTFTAADTLQPNGGQSGEAQARWNKTNFSMMDESNDYSYDSTKANFADWDKVTLYHNGALIWGIEP